MSSCAAPQDALQALSSVLQPLGLDHLADQHVLHPGQRREQLVRALLTRLLGGLNVDDIQFSGGELLQGLAEDERFAEKCHSVLKLLGVAATPEQLRGCSCNQQHDTLPLLHMAHLLQAMEKQRAGSGRAGPQPPEQQQQQGAAGASSTSQVAQLLCHTAANLSKLTADAVQLFPSDMSDTLEAYSDQGALSQLPRLSQEASSRAAQLKERLQQVLQHNGSDCEGAGSAEWQQLAADTAGALEALLRDVQAFDAMYQQELAVWANGASAEQQQPVMQLPWQTLQPGHGSPLPLGVTAGTDGYGGRVDGASAAGAEVLGRMARALVCGYQELRGLLAAFDGIRVQHQALKDVPAAALQNSRSLHMSDTNQLRMHAAAVQPRQP